MDALLCRGGQPLHELGPQCGIGVSFGRRGDDFFHLRGLPLVQLRDHVKELDPLAADTSQEKLPLGLDEPDGWSFGPERWESHGHS
jgi:hypothetical protein